METIIRNHMLVARNDVLITPHIAFNSREAVERILATTAENIEGFAAGTPVNVVTA
jgi:D-lactate dehydrogenase